MNLFSLTLLKQFEEFYINFNSPLQSYKENLNRFKLIWSYYSNKKNKNTIKVHNLLGFFKMLGSPLGCNPNDKIIKMGEKLKGLNIRRYKYNNFKTKIILYSDREENILFAELLFNTMKFHFKNYVYENNDPKAIRELQMNERAFFKGKP